MKKLVIGITGVLVLLGGAAVVVPSMIDWSQYKDPVIRMAEEATGYKVSVSGAIQVRLLPFPAFELNGVEVVVPGTAPPKPVFKASRVSASLALFPLLTGRIQVGTVRLETPDIHVHILENGQPDMPDILAQKWGWEGKKETNLPAGAAPALSGTKKAASVSFSGLVIHQGQITIKNDQTKQTHALQKLNLDAGLSSLYGPYTGQASGVYNTIAFNAQINAGDMADSVADVPVKADITFPDHGTRAAFDGTLSRRAGGDAQGTLRVKGPRVLDLVHQISGMAGSVPSVPLELTTLISATPYNIVLDQIDLAYDKARVTGTIKTRLKDVNFPRPLIHARLDSAGIVDLRPFLASSKTAMPVKKGTGASAATSPSTARTKAPELPVDLDIAWQAGGIQMGPEAIKDVTLTLTTDKGQMRGRVQAGALPGSGNLDMTIYPGSNGWVMANAGLNINDPAKFMAGGLGMAVPDALSAGDLREMKIKTELQMSPEGQVRAESGSATWRGGQMGFGGSAYEPRAGKLPLVTLALSGSLLDLDTLMPSASPRSKGSATAAPPPLKETVKAGAAGLQLPFDLTARLDFGTVKRAGYTMKDVKVTARSVAGGLTIEALSIADIHGAALDARGQIANVNAMTGMDMTVALTAPDGKAVTQKFAPEYADKWPKTGPLRLNLTYKGDLNKADVNVKALAFGVGGAIAGPIADPLGTPSFDSLQMTLTADQAGDSIRLVQPGFKKTAPLQGPMNVTATATIKGHVYAFKNLTGTFGQMSVKGEVTADMGGARPKVSGALNLGDVPLDALMGVERATSAGTAPSSSPSSASAGASQARWSTAPVKTDWMRAFDLDFGVSANKITYNLWMLSNASMTLVLNNGSMQVGDARASVFGGTISGKGALKSTTPGAPMEISATLDMADVNARSLTNAFLNKNRNRVDGTVSMRVDVAGRGASPMDLVSGLNGSASSSGRDVTINGIDVAKLVSWLTTDLKPSTTLDGLTGSFMGTGATTFKTHTGLYTVKNGLIVLDRAEFDGAQAKLETNGTVDLPTWRMDTKTTLSVKQPANVPPLSFTLRGPIDRPTQNMLGGVFESYLQQQLGKQVNKLIDKELGDKLKDLGLGGLLGGGEKSPAAAPAPAPVVDPVVPVQTEEVAPPAPEPAVEQPRQKIKPEDVLMDVLEGLAR